MGPGGDNEGERLASSRIPLVAAAGASMVTRLASRRAFLKEGRGVVTRDMLSEIGGAFSEIFGAQGEKGWGQSKV